MTEEFFNEISTLLDLRSCLQTPCKKETELRFTGIESLIGFEVPASVKKIFELSDKVNASVDGVLSGYEVHTIDQLEEIYSSKNKPLSFFGEYPLDQSFNLTENEFVEVFDSDPDLDKEAKPRIVTNISRFLPLARHRGDYLVVDLMSQSQGSLYELMMGFSANLYAPTIEKHLSSVITGLKNKVFSMEDGFIDFPVYWCHRAFSINSNQ